MNSIDQSLSISEFNVQRINPSLLNIGTKKCNKSTFCEQHRLSLQNSFLKAVWTIVYLSNQEVNHPVSEKDIVITGVHLVKGFVCLKCRLNLDEILGLYGKCGTCTPKKQ